MNGRMREGTAGIFRKGFAVFALAGLLAAAAVMTGCEDALAALEGEEDSKKTEEQVNYDENGWNLDDLTDNTNENGTLFSDVDGLDRQGYNEQGWNAEDYNKTTGTKFDSAGYDREGYDEAGYDAEGYDRENFDVYGWDKAGTGNKNKTPYDNNGYKKDGTYKETNSPFANDDEYGMNGLDRDGYNEQGWNAENNNKTTGTKFDSDGYDVNGLNVNGFDVNKDYKGQNGVKYASDNDYGNKGYDVDGLNNKGFNKNGFYKNGGSKIATDNDYGNQGYDQNGWNEHGFKADGTYKETGNQFANDNDYGYQGYDKDGYNANELHKDTHKNKQGGDYGLNGKDWEGHEMPAKLAGLDGNEVFASSGATKDITIPTQITPFDLNSANDQTSNLSGAISGMLIGAAGGGQASNFVGQSASLSYAYQQVASKYSSLQTMATTIATQEKTMATQAYTALYNWNDYVTTYSNNINNIWTAVFNGKEDAKTKFDAYLNAYKIALYKGQSVRNDNTEASNADTAFVSAVNTLNSTHSAGLGTVNAVNNTTRDALKAALLDQIKGAMNIDANVSIPADREILGNLNKILLQQTADVEELRAFLDDVAKISNAPQYLNFTEGYNLQTEKDSIPAVQVGSKVNFQTIISAMGTQKLNDLINGFDPEYLKLKQQAAGKDEIALV